MENSSAILFGWHPACCSAPWALGSSSLVSQRQACTKLLTFTTGRYDPHRCNALLHSGRWSYDTGLNATHAEWQPAGCMLRHFNNYDLPLRCLERQKIVFVGDSTARQVFFSLTAMLSKGSAIDHAAQQQIVARVGANTSQWHSDVSIPIANAPSLDFFWDPYLDSSLWLFDEGQDWPDAVIIGVGSWHARYLEDNHERHFAKDITLFTDKVIAATQCSDPPVDILLIALPILEPDTIHLSPERSRWMTSDRMSKLQSVLESHEARGRLEVLQAAGNMVTTCKSTYDDSGIHVNRAIAAAELDIVLNRVCNSAPSEPPAHYCCSWPLRIDATQWAIILATLIILFMSSILEILNAFDDRLGTRLRPRKASTNKAVVVLAGVAFYCFHADRMPTFEKLPKLANVQVFCILCVFLLAASMCFTGKCKAQLDEKVAHEMPTAFAALLSREQTEEWKGWMQLLILLYHYFGMSQVLWVYKIVRLLVGSYLFLTGFGHAMYLLKTKDFSLRRFSLVLVRLNLLSCLLAFTMGTRYVFYYFPALASFWYIVTWVTIRQASGQDISLKRGIASMTVSMMVLSMLFRLRRVWILVLQTSQTVGMASIDTDEMLFRIELDVLPPYAGMLAAFLFERWERPLLPPSMYSQKKIVRLRFFGVFTAAVAMTLHLSYLLGPRLTDKQTSNAFHRLTSICPILSFIILRNATSGLRRHYSIPFAWLGRRSLETFVLQYHIWLAADTKGLLHLGLFDTRAMYGSSTLKSPLYWLECCLLTVIFLGVSSVTSGATTEVTAWIMGPKGGSIEQSLQPSQHSRHSPATFSTCMACLQSRTRRLPSQNPLAQRLAILLLSLWALNLLSLV